MTEDQSKPRFSITRLLPLLAVIAAIALFFAMGWNEYFSLRLIADSRDAIQNYVEMNFLLALTGFIALYVVAVTLSLPVGATLTVMGGFLFGQLIGGTVVVFAATLGATAIFLIAKTALGDALAARAGGAIKRLRAGFAEDAFNYLLFLRLVFVFPFVVVNIAPAFLGVRVRTYIIATFFGIIPGTFAYAFVGGGLDSIITSAQADDGFQACIAAEAAGAQAAGSCELPIDFGDFVTPEIGIAIIALGVASLIPVVIKRLRSN